VLIGLFNTLIGLWAGRPNCGGSRDFPFFSWVKPALKTYNVSYSVMSLRLRMHEDIFFFQNAFFKIRWGVQLDEWSLLVYSMISKRKSNNTCSMNERNIRKGGGREVLLVLPRFYAPTFKRGPNTNLEFSKIRSRYINGCSRIFTLLTHWGRVTQICVFTLQLCKTDDANLRF